MGIYFSVDYRSPPSGFGQIIDPSQPIRVSGDRWNSILIAFTGCGQRDDPSYKETYYIDTENYTYPSRQIVIQTYHILKQHGVEEVYDTELYYEVSHWSFNGKFKLEHWYKLLLGEEPEMDEEHIEYINARDKEILGE